MCVSDCVTNDAFLTPVCCFIQIASRMFVCFYHLLCAHQLRALSRRLGFTVHPLYKNGHQFVLCYYCEAYEKGHQRPALTVYTFQNPDSSTGGAAAGGSGGSGPVTAAKTSAADIAQRASNSSIASRPPIPVVSFSPPLMPLGCGQRAVIITSTVMREYSAEFNLCIKAN